MSIFHKIVISGFDEKEPLNMFFERRDRVREEVKQAENQGRMF
jgi:hypothetical protein